MSTLYKAGVESWWSLAATPTKFEVVNDEEDEEGEGGSGFEDTEQVSKPNTIVKGRAVFTCAKNFMVDVEGRFYVLSPAFEYCFHGLFKNRANSSGCSVFDTEKLDYRPKPFSQELLLGLVRVQADQEAIRNWLSFLSELPSRDALIQKAGTPQPRPEEQTLVQALRNLLADRTAQRYIWYAELQLLEDYYGKSGREFLLHNLSTSELVQLHGMFVSGDDLHHLCFPLKRELFRGKLRRLPELAYDKFMQAQNKVVNLCEPIINNAISMYHEILRVDLRGHSSFDYFNKSKKLLYKPTSSGHLYTEYGTIVRHCRVSELCDASLRWLFQQGITVEPPLQPNDWLQLHTKRHIYIASIWHMQQRLIQQLTSIEACWREGGEERGMTLRTGSYGKIRRILNKKQVAAVEAVIQHSISVITGRGGTGKTEAVKNIVERYGNDDPEQNTVLFLGPTGCSAVNATKRVIQAFTLDKCAHALRKAAQLQRKGKLEERLAAAADADMPPPMDVHWYLQMTPQEHRNQLDIQRKNEFATLVRRWRQTEVLIIDELSMVDIEKLEFVLRTLTHFAPVKKLVLLGDWLQLQSIGPGRIMADIMAALPNAAVMELDINMRNESETVFTNASICISGSSSRLQYDDSFQLIPCTKTTDMTRVITDFYRRLNKPGFRARDVHFIAFRRKHVTAINKICRCFHTEHYEPRSDGRGDRPEFFVGECIYFKKNNYVQGVMNGQLWTIVKYIDVLEEGMEQDIVSNLQEATPGALARIVLLLGDDEQTELALDLDDLPLNFSTANLGYATTIHKFQGKEKPIIAYWLAEDHFLENVTHFYTAITRSTRCVYLFSNERVISSTMHRSAPQRRSRFSHYLSESLDPVSSDSESDSSSSSSSSSSESESESENESERKVKRQKCCE